MNKKQTIKNYNRIEEYREDNIYILKTILRFHVNEDDTLVRLAENRQLRSSAEKWAKITFLKRERELKNRTKNKIPQNVALSPLLGFLILVSSNVTFVRAELRVCNNGLIGHKNRYI